MRGGINEVETREGVPDGCSGVCAGRCGRWSGQRRGPRPGRLLCGQGRRLRVRGEGAGAQGARTSGRGSCLGPRSQLLNLSKTRSRGALWPQPCPPRVRADARLIDPDPDLGPSPPQSHWACRPEQHLGASLDPVTMGPVQLFVWVPFSPSGFPRETGKCERWRHIPEGSRWHVPTSRAGPWEPPRSRRRARGPRGPAEGPPPTGRPHGLPVRSLWVPARPGVRTELHPCRCTTLGGDVF